MKKEIAIIGLVLIFAGIISAGSARLSVTNVNETTGSDVYQAWEVSGYFQKGENISAFYTWNIDLTEIYEGDLPVNVTITVNNNVTKLQVLFRMRPVGTWEPTPGQPEETPIDIWGIRLLEADPDSLYVTDPPRQVGGITQQEGLYTIRVLVDTDLTEPWWAWVYTEDGPAPRPPQSTRIAKYKTIVTYPYAVLGPAGAASVVAGVGLGIVGTRLPSAEKRTKSKHKSTRSHKVHRGNRKHF